MLLDDDIAWNPSGYIETSVYAILSAEPADTAQVDRTVGQCVVLVAAAGAHTECDRLVRCWQEVTERPVASLVSDELTARALGTLLATRRERPRWAAELPPVDLDAAERAHRAYLQRSDPPVGHPLLDRLDDTGRRGPHPLKRLAAEAEAAAASTNREMVIETLRDWIARAGPRPRFAMLAGCRHLASMLAAGSLNDALGIDECWAQHCVGDLIAALHARHPVDRGATSTEDANPWPVLITRILTARRIPGQAPPTAEPLASAEAIMAAERRLGLRLPDDYRQFLATSNGLPADVIFPRLLAVEELVPGSRNSVLISERTDHATIMLVASGDPARWQAVESDPVLGATCYPAFRAVLENHLRLLQAAGSTP